MSHIQPIDHFRVSEDSVDLFETQDRLENVSTAICELEQRAERGCSMFEQFNAHRPMMFRIACHILGRASDADDMVQELWLRWQRQEPGRIQSARAWLGSAMKRLCIDQLRSARRQREDSYGVGVPETLAAQIGFEADPSADQEYALVTACARMLETLRPVERVVFTLYEVFGYDHSGAALVIGMDVANCRQILHRARARLKADRIARSPSQPAFRVAKQIAIAATTGDLTALLTLLNEEHISCGRRSTGAGRRVEDVSLAM